MALEWIENEDGTRSLVNPDDLLVEQACPTDPMDGLRCESCE